jgi:hypothetical protein
MPTPIASEAYEGDFVVSGRMHCSCGRKPYNAAQGNQQFRQEMLSTIDNLVTAEQTLGASVREYFVEKQCKKCHGMEIL